MQDVFDYVFKELEISIREIGYGDASINKKMKTYVNSLYSILEKIDNWENLKTSGSSEDAERILNLNELINDAIQYEEESEIGTLEDY